MDHPPTYATFVRQVNGSINDPHLSYFYYTVAHGSYENAIRLYETDYASQSPIPNPHLDRREGPTHGVGGAPHAHDSAPTVDRRGGGHQGDSHSRGSQSSDHPQRGDGHDDTHRQDARHARKKRPRPTYPSSSPLSPSPTLRPQPPRVSTLGAAAAAQIEMEMEMQMTGSSLPSLFQDHPEHHPEYSSSRTRTGSSPSPAPPATTTTTTTTSGMVMRNRLFAPHPHQSLHDDTSPSPLFTTALPHAAFYTDGDDDYDDGGVNYNDIDIDDDIDNDIDNDNDNDDDDDDDLVVLSHHPPSSYSSTRPLQPPPRVTHPLPSLAPLRVSNAYQANDTVRLQHSSTHLPHYGDLFEQCNTTLYIARETPPALSPSQFRCGLLGDVFHAARRSNQWVMLVITPQTTTSGLSLAHEVFVDDVVRMELDRVVPVCIEASHGIRDVLLKDWGIRITHEPAVLLCSPATHITPLFLHNGTVHFHRALLRTLNPLFNYHLMQGSCDRPVARRRVVRPLSTKTPTTIDVSRVIPIHTFIALIRTVVEYTLHGGGVAVVPPLPARVEHVQSQILMLVKDPSKGEVSRHISGHQQHHQQQQQQQQRLNHHHQHQPLTMNSNQHHVAHHANDDDGGRGRGRGDSDLMNDA